MWRKSYRDLLFKPIAELTLEECADLYRAYRWLSRKKFTPKAFDAACRTTATDPNDPQVWVARAEKLAF